MRFALIMVLFALSGFSGLAYQSLWTHYMGLVLGHAAYAQALTLMVYMGGLSLGAWCAGRIVDRLQSPLFWYAAIEAVIGLVALVFHPMFAAFQDVSLQSVLPALGGGWPASVYQWGTSILWLLPQSALLGATFPLLAAGVRTSGGKKDQRLLGGLYASNCTGAVFGALTTTFVLLPRGGMPQAMLVAGLVNLAVAAAAAALAKWSHPSRRRHVPQAIRSEPVAASRHRLLYRAAMVAGITGLTSFVYEIVWVRLLNQVMGTTLHSFEIMLASFIAGLALGAAFVGVWGREFGWRALGWVQVLMGLCAIGSNVLVAHSFGWMSDWVGYLQSTGGSYDLFNAGSAAIAILVMLPTAFFAGMTLPIITNLLLAGGRSSRAVGQVYAANTLGAIIGVVLAMHALIPLFGLQSSLLIAASIDALVGFWLLQAIRLRLLALVAGLGIALAASGHYGKIAPTWQLSGAYRGAMVQGNTSFRVAFVRDGKTATVAVGQDESSTWIATNGKTDAGLSSNPSDFRTDDSRTTTLLGVLPLAAHPRDHSAAVIGWGSGMSTHVLLGSPAVQRVDTIEIEPVMRDAARLFGARVARAYEDPRSFVAYEDARSFFTGAGRKFDIIVSEPSNPWVSGVASLFTREFYALLDRSMSDDGVLSQWMHSYHFTDKLLAMQVAALLDQFPNTEVFVSQDGDLVFVSHKGSTRISDDWRPDGALEAELGAMGLRSGRDLNARRLAGRNELAAFVRMMNAKPHRDFYPVVDIEAPRARFERREAAGLFLLARSGFPVREVFDGVHGPVPSDTKMAENLSMEILSRVAGRGENQFEMPSTGAWAVSREKMKKDASRFAALSAAPVPASQVESWATMGATTLRASLGSVDQATGEAVWAGPWLADNQLPIVQDLAAAFVSLARKDPTEMVKRNRHALARYPQLPAQVREHLFVAALYGLRGQQQCFQAKALSAQHAALPRHKALDLPRRLVEQWAIDCGR